jgi:hypothetical protein
MIVFYNMKFIFATGETIILRELDDGMNQNMLFQ